MLKYCDFPVVFRVLEVGKRGYLHYHFVSSGFMDHSKVLEVWRSLTGEASNVHVSGHRGRHDPKRLVGYLTKYLTKSSCEYRWCGAFYGLGRERSRSVRTDQVDTPVPGSYGELYYGKWTEQDNNYGSDRKHTQTGLSIPEGVNTNGKYKLHKACDRGSEEAD